MSVRKGLLALAMVRFYRRRVDVTTWQRCVLAEYGVR
jgi:hypothetical protein